MLKAFTFLRSNYKALLIGLLIIIIMGLAWSTSHYKNSSEAKAEKITELEDKNDKLAKENERLAKSNQITDNVLGSNADTIATINQLNDKAKRDTVNEVNKILQKYASQNMSNSVEETNEISEARINSLWVSYCSVRSDNLECSKFILKE